MARKIAKYSRPRLEEALDAPANGVFTYGTVSSGSVSDSVKVPDTEPLLKQNHRQRQYIGYELTKSITRQRCLPRGSKTNVSRLH